MESLTLDLDLTMEPRRQSPLHRLLGRGWKTSLPVLALAIPGLLYAWLVASEALRGIGITTPLLLLLVAYLFRRPGKLRFWETIASRILILVVLFFASHIILIPIFQLIFVSLVAVLWFTLRPVGAPR